MSDVISAKAARRAEEMKAQQEKKKLTVKVYAVVAVVVLLIVFVAVFGSNLFYNGTDALEINGVGYSVADFNFNYFSAYNNYYQQLYSMYGSMASYLMPSTSTSLRDAQYMEGESTWADYFTEMAIQRMTEITMLCDAAKNAGYTLSQEDLDGIEETITGLKTQATSGGFTSFQQYLTYCYGKGMTEKIFRKNMEMESLASAYSQSVNDSYQYTEEEIRDHYAQHKDDYDVIVYRSYFVSGNAVEDDADTPEDETVTLEDAMAKAEADAQKVFDAASSDGEQGYLDALKELNSSNANFDPDASTKYHAQGSSLSAVLKDWLIDSARKPGDFTTIKTADDSNTHGYYIVYFLERSDNSYDAVSGYYAIVAKDTTLQEGSFENSEAYESSVQELAESGAKELLSNYDSSAEDTLASFTSAVTKNASFLSDYGPLSQVGPYDVPESIKDWLFDSSRKEGDTTYIYDKDNGCFVVYYTGVDGVYADLLSETIMRGEAYNEWEDAQLENYSADREWELKLATKISALGG